MEKQKNICAHCGNLNSNHNETHKNKFKNTIPNQKLAFRIILVLAAFLLEGVFLWAFAESRVFHSPVQADIEIPVKKEKKGLSLASQRIAKVPDSDNQPQSSDSLIIPKLNINSAVEYVGKTANGEMATSQSLYNVAWYKDGGKPGQNGSVVLAGHYGGPYEKGIFRTADRLIEGDTIEYRFKNGKAIKYKVFFKSKYKLANMPLREIFNKNDGKYLNLITCYGNWDKNTSTYDERLVVYAKQI